MNVLVVGQGGREHALVRALKLSQVVKNLHALPGSDGISQDARCHMVSWQDFPAVLELVTREAIDLVVIGPELPLEAGLSDALREKGIAVFAPSREAAKLENSKIYSKEFMIDAGVPTARHFVVSSVEQTKSAASAFQPPYVLKADGLAEGKGVFICKTLDELLRSAKAIFEDKKLGTAGMKALLEEFQPGYEISYHVLTDGERFESLPLAQDHKRLSDGDEGPNTGGMGTVAPVQIDADLRAKIDREIVAPTIARLKSRRLVYRGVLYFGLMITRDGPSVLEYNTRFGDPETQVMLPLLDGDWGLVVAEVARGKLPKLKWHSKRAACCVVLAAEGYPDAAVRGAEIFGLGGNDSDTSYVLHSGTKKDSQGHWSTNGGRVVGAIGLGQDIGEAIDRAYQLARKISWKKMQMRSDIGAKVQR